MAANTQHMKGTGGSSGIDALLIALVGLLAVLVLMAVLVTKQGRVSTTEHADKHSEAELIRNRCQQNGPNQVWEKNDAPDIVVWLVELTDGRWGCWFLQHWPSEAQKINYRERTAFCPRDGSKRSAIAYLKCFATRIR